MGIITDLFSPAFVEAMGWTIVHSLWQGIVVALTLSLLLVITRKNSAQFRYILSFSALIILLFWSGVTFFSAYSYAHEKQELREKIITTPGYVKTFIAENTNTDTSVSEESQTTSPVNYNALKMRAFFQRHFNLICMVWLLGMAFLITRFIGGFLYSRRLRTQQLTPLGDEWLEKMLEMADKLGIDRRISIFKSQIAKVPMTLGAFKPVILFPVSMLTGLSAKEIEAVFAHELAHVMRHDYLFNFIQSLVEILFFYQPAVWIISGHIRAERENSCDNIAIELTGDKVTYAKALAAVEIQTLQEANFAMAFSGNKGSLLKRIQRLQTNTTMKTNFTEGVIASIVIVVGLLLASFTLENNDVGKANPDIKREVLSKKVTSAEKDSIRIEMEKSLKELEISEKDQEEIKKLVDVALSEQEPEHMAEISEEISKAIEEINFEQMTNDILKVTSAALKEASKGLQLAGQEIREENVNKEMRGAAREIERARKEMEEDIRRDMRQDGINEELINATVNAASSGMDIAAHVVENIDVEGIISSALNGVSIALNSMDTATSTDKDTSDCEPKKSDSIKGDADKSADQKASWEEKELKRKVRKLEKELKALQRKLEENDAKD